MKKILILFILISVNNAVYSEQLEAGKSYDLYGYTEKLISLSEKGKCIDSGEVKVDDKSIQCHSNKKVQTCRLYRGSEFTVVNTDADITTIVIDYSLDLENIWNTDSCNAKRGFVYTLGTPTLQQLSKTSLGLLGRVNLKAILVPQKFYTSSNRYSSNPTIGIGLSFTPDINSDLKFLYSLTIGAGFNQLTVDTPEDSIEKTGFSYFIGWDFADSNKGLSAGIYYGRDIVDLGADEKFNGGNNEKQNWIGLVLSLPIK